MGKKNFTQKKAVKPEDKTKESAFNFYGDNSLTNLTICKKLILDFIKGPSHKP